MEVLTVSHMFPNSAKPRLGVFVLEQLRALTNIGVAPIVVAPTPWVPPGARRLRRFSSYASIPAFDLVSGIPVEYVRTVCFPGGFGFFLEGVFQYLCLVRRVTELCKLNRFRLIHAHTITDGVTAILLGRRLGLPVVCTVHGSDVHTYPFQALATRYTTQWALRRVPRLIVVSNHLRELVFSLVGRRQVAVIHNGAHPERFKSRAKAESRVRLGLPVAGGIVLFVGALIKVKGPEFLLQAAARIPGRDFRIYMVGDGELKAQLVELATNLGLLQLCHFVGERPHDEIPLWLTAADVLVAPSIIEGLPTLLPEAMLSRVPIVASSVGGIPDILRHEESAVLVPPGNVSALTAAVEAILNDEALASRLAEAAEHTAKSVLTWEANARATAAIYQDLLGSSSIAVGAT